MRNLVVLDGFRDYSEPVIKHYGWAGDGGNGAFRIESPIDRGELVIIASDGGGWDRVSVSRRNRCPNWQEMEHVKRIFFRDDETAMQLHVPPAEHLSHHPFCLHLWRPQNVEIPRPPAMMVAPTEQTVIHQEPAS